MECSIDGCSRNARYKATGWCQTHYHRYWRTGSTDDPVPGFPRTDLTYFGAHARTKAYFGSATKYTCIQCGGPAGEWAYDGTDPSEREDIAQGRYRVVYSVWPEFYMPMCTKCHRTMDCAARFLRREACTHGHELTPENTYTRPSRPRTRECKTCRAAESASRYQAKKATHHEVVE